MTKPTPADYAEVEARESDQSPKRVESMRRIRFARSFWESVIEQQLGDEHVFGRTTIEIVWKAGEAVQVDVNPGRTYK